MPGPRRLACLAAVLALGGCGHPRATDAVRSAVGDFGTAVGARDYTRICDHLLAGVLVAKLDDSGVPCALALRTGLGAAEAPRLSIRTIAVNGDKALAQVHSTATNQPPSDDTLELVKEHGAWKISSLARPEPQPPATTQP